MHLDRSSIFRLAVALGVLAAGGARAQTLELADLERSALERSPELARAAARVEAARARAEGAAAPGDPTLEVWARNVLPELTDREETASAVEVEIVQPVRYPGKRQAAEASAAGEVAAAEAGLLAARTEILFQVRAAFADLVAADREQRTLGDSHDLLDLMVATARSRFGTTQEPALAVLEAELAIDEHDLTLEEAFSRFLAMRARVASLAGLDPKSVPLLVGALPAVSFPVAEGPLPYDGESPRLRAFRARVEAAERRVEAAKLDLKPDFGVGGGFHWPEGDNPALTAKVGVDLPFFRKRRMGPRLHAAEAELSEARAALAGEEIAVKYDSTRLGAERDRYERTMKRLAGSVVPRSSAALDAARIAFLNEQIPFSRLLDMQRDWFHARVELAVAEAARFRIWAEAQKLRPAEESEQTTATTPQEVTP